MEPFTHHTGRYITLDRANTDTDAIIPARYLKRIERTGYGDLLFRDLRYRGGDSDQPIADFPLNRPEAAGATVLVARQNFGCGSSREHAVWAIEQAGFRVVLAPRIGDTPGFADIFRNNSYKNGLLPVEISAELADRLFSAGGGEISVDLQALTVVARLGDQELSESFSVPSGPRSMLLQGLDEIGVSLEYLDRIGAFEARRWDPIPVG